MQNCKEYIEEVMSSSLNDKQKKDKLLEYDTMMYCYLGIDSTKTDKETVKKNSRAIYRSITKLDPRLGKSFLWYLD
jgi:hypothetical protein